MLVGNFFKDIKQEHKNHYFSGINFNSKKIRKDNIFFAIKGNKFDGSKYIKEAIKNGAKTIISKKKFQGKKDKILFLKFSNVRKVLSEVSFGLCKNKPQNLIAVTGTNGKSSIADFYFQILNLNKVKVASIGTLGIRTNKNKIKVKNTTLDPIKLGQIFIGLKRKRIDNVILEASSHGLKQNRLDGLVFNTGIFTNLSRDHLDYHKSYKDYLNSKLYLFKNLLKSKGDLIVDKDIPQFEKIRKISRKKRLKINDISYNESVFQLLSHEFHHEAQIVNFKYKKKFYKFKINLLGKIQIKNLIMAIIAAEKSGIKMKKIMKIINKIKPVDGRFEKIGKIKNESMVILDYAHTPEALKICLENLKNQFEHKKISIVFGCGGERDKIKRPIMGKIANEYCDKVYLTDDNPRSENPKKIRSQIKKKIQKSKVYEIASRKEAICRAIKDLNSGEILVIAGKGHETIQDFGFKKNYFSDKEVINDSIKEKNKKLSNNLKINIINETNSTKKIEKKCSVRKSSINSKELKKNDIFFAIKGKNNDGNNFVEEALKKRASLAVVNRINRKLNLSKQIKVKDSLNFLTKCSSIYRKSISTKIIAITGSCGKTSLKELLGVILRKFFKVGYSPKSYNNKFGVPLSLFNLDQNNDFGILEVGMDKKGEIDFLSHIVKPDIGVITNISYAHAKNFKNLKQIALAKSEIINNIKKNGVIVLNADDQFINLFKEISRKRKLKIVTFGMTNKNSDIKLDSIIKIKNKYKIVIINKKKKYSFIVSNNYENNIRNLLAAFAIIHLFKDLKTLNKYFVHKFNTPQGRGDVAKISINKKKKIFLIDESYNSNPLSLTTAIKNFDKLNLKNSSKHVLLGDMLELGKHSKKLHLSISKILNKSSIKSVNVFGKHILDTFNDIRDNKKGHIIKDFSQIIKLIKFNLNNNDYLMIKGSNSTGLNKFVNKLKNKNINAL